MTSNLFKAAREAADVDAQTTASQADPKELDTAVAEAQTFQHAVQYSAKIKVSLEDLKESVSSSALDPISRHLVDQTLQYVKPSFGDTSKPVAATESNDSWRRQTTACLEGLIGDATRVIEQKPGTTPHNVAVQASNKYVSIVQLTLANLQATVTKLKQDLTAKVHDVAANPNAVLELQVFDPKPEGFAGVISVETSTAIAALALSRDFLVARTIDAAGIERIKQELCADKPVKEGTTDVFDVSCDIADVGIWLKPYFTSDMAFIEVQKEDRDPVGEEQVENHNQEQYLEMLNTALKGLQTMEGLLASMAAGQITEESAQPVIAYPVQVFVGMTLSTLMDKVLTTYAMLL